MNARPARQLSTETDLPLTLTEAVDMFFPGKATVATLRAEAARGHLTVFKIGKRLYTTRAAMREMIELCRVPKALASTSTPAVSSGSSETEQISSAQAALELTLAELKNSSRSTSAGSTHPSRARRH
jgi:hypothetical protein